MSEAANQEASEARWRRYAVMRCDDEWRIQTQHRSFGHFKHEGTAWSVAVGLAEADAAEGLMVELSRQGRSGTLSVELVYGAVDRGAEQTLEFIGPNSQAGVAG